MKALVIDGIGRSSLREVGDDAPGAGEVLLDIQVVGLCGSDLNTFTGANPLVQLPRIPGHEISAVIRGRGRGIDPSLTEGRRVIVMPYTACGECAACRAGRPNACRYNRTLGVQQDGGLRQRLVVQADNLIVNNTLTPRRQAMVEPLAVGFHGVGRGRVTADDCVVVLGCGMIGLGAILAAARRGAEVVAVDISGEKRGIALALGATSFFNASDPDYREQLRDFTDDRGFDVVIEAVGRPETFAGAIDLAAYAGRVVYIGYSKAPVSYDTAWFNLKELDILGSRNATRADFGDVIACLEEMGPASDPIVTQVYGFDESADALGFWRDHRADVVKILVEVA